VSVTNGQQPKPDALQIPSREEQLAELRKALEFVVCSMNCMSDFASGNAAETVLEWGRARGFKDGLFTPREKFSCEQGHQSEAECDAFGEPSTNDLKTEAPVKDLWSGGPLRSSPLAGLSEAAPDLRLTDEERAECRRRAKEAAEKFTGKKTIKPHRDALHEILGVIAEWREPPPEDEAARDLDEAEEALDKIRNLASASLWPTSAADAAHWKQLYENLLPHHDAWARQAEEARAELADLRANVTKAARELHEAWVAEQSIDLEQAALDFARAFNGQDAKVEDIHRARHALLMASIRKSKEST
jgi:hypothetical protein